MFSWPENVFDFDSFFSSIYYPIYYRVYNPLFNHFLGDYWVSEAEVIIKDINNENLDQTADEDNATEGNNFKMKKRKKSKQRPTRSARGSLTPAVKSERDPVMTKLSGTSVSQAVSQLVSQSVSHLGGLSI